MSKNKSARLVQNPQLNNTSFSSSLILTTLTVFITYYASYRMLGEAFCNEKPRFIYSLAALPLFLPEICFEVSDKIRPMIRKIYYGLLAASAVIFLFYSLKETSSLHTAWKELIDCFTNQLNAYRAKTYELYTVQYSAALYVILLFPLLCLLVGTLRVSARLHMRFLLLMLPGLCLMPSASVGHVPSHGSYELILLSALLSGMAQFSLELTAGKPDMKQFILSLSAPILILISLLFVPGISGRFFLTDATAMMEYSTDSQKMFDSVWNNFKSKLFTHTASMTIENKTPDFENKEVFTVTLSNLPKDNLYLKRSVGDTFDGTRWIDTFSVDDATNDLLTEDELFRRFHVRNPYADTSHQVRVTLSYLNFPSTDEPIPYQLMGLPEGFKVSGDGLLKKKKKKAESEYAVWTPVADTYSLPNLSQIIYLSEAQFSDTLPEGYASYSIAENTKLQVTYDIVQILANTVLSENGYTSGDFMNAPPDNPQRFLLANKVSDYLASRYYYSLTPGQVPENRSTVEYFLSDSKYGFCIHFATAGALILRQMGIPARYATGYIVKPSDFSRDENGDFVATVKDSAGHAWVEIFLDDYGWYPIEMTKGYRAVPSESIFTPYVPEPSSEEIDVNSPEVDETTESTESTSDSSNTEDGSSESGLAASSSEQSGSSSPNESQIGNTESGAANTSAPAGSETSEETGADARIPIGKILKGLLLTALGITVLSALFYFLPKYIQETKRRKRARLRRQLLRGNSIAVRKVNRLVYKQLRGKILRTSRQAASVSTDVRYKALLIETYPDISETAWNRYFRLVESSLFGNELLEKEEAEFIWDIYNKVEADKKARS